jgi:hypothetical protein
MTVQLPSGENVAMGAANASLVETSLAEAKSRGNKLAGIILKGAFTPLLINALGPISAILKIGETERVLGTLNVIIDPAASASPPQPLQSQPAAPAS